MTAAPTQLNLYFPLFGVAFASDAVGEIARGVEAYVPKADEWRALLKTEMWKAQPDGASEPDGDADEPEPPCCIVAHSQLPEGPHNPNEIAAFGNVLLGLARDAVVALRLLRPGWFLHPEQSMHLFYAPTLPLNVLRAPGPYRQVFVTGLEEPGLPKYDLPLAELTRTGGAPSTISAVWQLLQAYRRTGGDMSVELAIESFHRSYGYQLAPRSRAGYSFTALEAMLGGMNAWWIGRVPVKPRGYAQRVEAALRTSTAPQRIDSAQDASAWLASEQGARGLRNAIVHGVLDAGEAPARDAHERLQAIVRSVLYQYLQFAGLWLAHGPELAARLSLEADSPLAAAYVTTLEAGARQPGSMLDLLQ